MGGGGGGWGARGRRGVPWGGVGWVGGRRHGMHRHRSCPTARHVHYGAGMAARTSPDRELSAVEVVIVTDA